MKKTNYNTFSKEEINKEISSKEKEIRDIAFSLQGVTNKNTMARRDAKKFIARAKTALRAQLDK